MQNDQAKQNSRPDWMPPQRHMTEEQREQALRVTSLGIQWSAGTISIDDIEREIGRQDPYKVDDKTSYTYGRKDFYFTFYQYANKEKDKSGNSRGFRLTTQAWITSNIPRDLFESRLGLKKVKNGELIDGYRKEELRYFNPPQPTSPRLDIASFNYRLPMPDDSPFDVTLNTRYQAAGEQPRLSDFETTTDLRNIDIGRWYLDPDEIEERNQKKRLKYSEMDLRTGMICPESGVWEGWTDRNECFGALYMKEGWRFLDVCTRPNTPFAFLEPGRWFYKRPGTDSERSFG
ncbi:hypothetical protein [Ralstonia sp. 24A2]|uniref:hypothetical protein n=1 Tax=Ralstonia sp. 24A2 TaxID=3447364 RepID=UPI003F6A2D27